MKTIAHVREWSAELSGNPGIDRSVRAYARAARWQLAHRLGAPRAVAKVGPAQIYCYPGSTEGSGALYAGFLEWNETAFVIRQLRPGDHFVDIGSNIGTYSCFAGSFVDGLSITAVEPGEPFPRLDENLDANGLTAARRLNCAVGEFDGEVEFTVGMDVMNSIATNGEQQTRRVAQVTLDSLTADRAADLVKIDVEGAELDVFRGAPKTLEADDAPVLLFELNGRCAEFGHSPSEVCDHLRSRGFQLFEYDGVENALVAFDGDGIPASNNLVAAKDPDTVADRLRTSEYATELSPLPIRSSINWRGNRQAAARM